MRVHYHTNQNVVDNTSSSPSAGKPALLLEHWKRLSLPIEVVTPRPLTAEEISLAHDPAYVKGVLECRLSNGFANRLESVAKSLPWTTGSMASAAIDAFTNKRVTVSLTSGFHHAGYRHGSGYCTFNGLVISCQILKNQHGIKRVGILDCDAHYGDGTDQIIKHLKLDYIKHWTFGEHYHNPKNATKFIAELPKIVDSYAGCDTVLYQAGADPHINDPLGGTLTTKQMRERDRIVFEGLKKLGIPVAWNLAGGYQTPIEKVLELHTATLEEGLRAVNSQHEIR